MQKTTILVAEDNETDVLFLQRIFQRLPVPPSVQVVQNGEETIEYLSGKGKFSDRNIYPLPSLLILDMSMPKMSGDQVLEWLKGKPEVEKLFVVVLTGASRRLGNDKMFEQHGNICIFNSHFLKPATETSIQGLLHLFEGWLQRDINRSASHDELASHQ